jgi:pyruvate,water dikinase
MFWDLSELPDSARPLVGGKAATLAQLIQAGYPVPEGIALSREAFQNGELRPESWDQIAVHLASLRKGRSDASFAVRSSALSEDSATASFAGEFESVLNVATDNEIREAVQTVYRSRENERVSAYSHAQGITATSGTMAIIIQRMVPATLAGVLFTVDPVTGSQAHMDGNYVQGLGDRLVSGEVSGRLF